MTQREIILSALERLHISQPNTQQLDKARKSLMRCWNELLACDAINGQQQVVPYDSFTSYPMTNHPYGEEITANNVMLINGLIDNGIEVRFVDFMTWLKHKEDTGFAHIERNACATWTLWHKFENKNEAYFTCGMNFSILGLDDDVEWIDWRFVPLIEVYICKDLARSPEQLARWTAEYDRLSKAIIKSTLVFDIPTREL